MERRAVPPQRLMATMLAVTAPSAATLIVLVGVTALSPLAALAAYGVIAATTAFLIHPHLGDLAAMTRWMRSLAQGVDAEPPRPRHERLVVDMIAAIAQLRRTWQSKQSELAKAARWHETLFDRLPDPLVLMADGRRVTRINEAARAAFGRDISGRDLAVVLRTPAVLEAADAVLGGAPGQEVEFTLPVPVERVFIARVERLGAGADGSTAILALHDITTVRRIEQMRADFVANASHELRTPLSTLLGFIETLKGAASDDAEARDRFLGIMHEQGTRMARLINDLLSLSRIELNEHSPPSDRVALAHIAERAIEAMQPLAAAKRMTLVARIDAATPTVPGQADELTQLVQNLLENAIKYGREGTPVEVTLRPAGRPLPTAAAHLTAGGAVAISVADQGEGIAREHLPRLTERFYRVDTARSRTLGGTGLGLAIVKHIVNRHRGALVIDSTMGRGSVFTVFLPAASGDET